MIELIVRIANYVFAFGMPFSHIAGYFAGFVSFLFIWKFRDSLKKERIFIWICIFVVYGIIRSIFSSEPKAGFGAMFGYLSSWLWPFVLGYALSDFDSFRRALAGYFVTIVVIVFFSMLAYFGLFYREFPGNFYLVHDGLLKGLRSHIALAAICLVLSFLSLSQVVLRKDLMLKNKAILGAVTLFFIGAIFLTGSRGYYIGGLISYTGFAAFWLITTRRWRIFLVGSAIFFSTVAVLYFASPGLKDRITNTGAGDNNVRERLALYRVAVSEIRARPVFGFGPGQAIKQKEYFNILPEEQRNVSRHPHLHSFYLNLAADFGLLGLSIFAIILYCIFAKLYLVFKTGSGLLGALAFGLMWGFAGVLAGECFDTLLRGPGTAMELFWFLGLISGQKGKNCEYEN